MFILSIVLLNNGGSFRLQMEHSRGTILVPGKLMISLFLFVFFPILDGEFLLLSVGKI